MTFLDIPAGASVFVDANVLVYHFTSDPQFGASCTDLVRRIERQEILGFVSSHVLSDISHRLMTIEAIMAFGWPAAGIRTASPTPPDGNPQTHCLSPSD